MSKLHLKALEEALHRKGWRVIAVHPGDDYRISATWEIQRSHKQPSQFIDFEGMDDLVCLPLEESYGCRIRGRPAKDDAASLYFRRPNKSRDLWEHDLAAFVLSLDNEGTPNQVLQRSAAAILVLSDITILSPAAAAEPYRSAE